VVIFSPSSRRFGQYATSEVGDLRSTIAHGGELPVKDIEIGEEKLNSGEAAKRAKDALRMLVKRFLPYAKNAPYRNSKFWEKAYFGLTESEQ
jgi:hypothetical protein